MKTVYSPLHAGHVGQLELMHGQLIPCFERPERVEIIREAIARTDLGSILSPEEHSLESARRVHDSNYVDFLPTVWTLWREAGGEGCAMPNVFPVGELRRDASLETVHGLLGLYSFDAGASFVEGTWQAIKVSQDVALTAADLLASGERAAFALCRPPGHHAGRSTMGGYCYLNNAAIAAQRLLDEGAERVTVLDIDYHHGNGTQEIFYRRGDVQAINIHCDPRHAFPYFLGHADERGEGDGEGANLNLPLPPGTGSVAWMAALETACGAIIDHAPDSLVVSLGVDTWRGDPISSFQLDVDDYPDIGARIAELDLPTLVVMEGGYAVAEIGVNVVGFLAGLDRRWKR